MNDIDRLMLALAALRKLAIVETQARGVQNAVVRDGHRCRVCLATWKLHQREHHFDDCPLKGTKP